LPRNSMSRLPVPWYVPAATSTVSPTAAESMPAWIVGARSGTRQVAAVPGAGPEMRTAAASRADFRKGPPGRLDRGGLRRLILLRNQGPQARRGNRQLHHEFNDLQAYVRSGPRRRGRDPRRRRRRLRRHHGSPEVSALGAGRALLRPRGRWATV